MSSSFFQFRERLTARGGPSGTSPSPAPTSAADSAALTVSQLTAQIDSALRGGLPASLLVRGEASNVKPNRGSGHLYFTLKDSEACVDCVMFRGDNAQLRFRLEEGLEVLARGHISTYGPKGRYQLYINDLKPVGKGASELAFQQLKARLDAEGLMDPSRKRPLPAFPMKIAIVTSREAAALQDVLKVLRRFPFLRVAVYHVPVQGDGCGQAIAAALRDLSRRASRLGIEAVLLCRGGGSIEDLCGFNEEAVARVVAACAVPVVTGIGHEVDTSIADLVADRHAHTPTAAAEALTARWRMASDELTSARDRLRRAVHVTWRHARQRLASVERHETFRRPMGRIHQLRQLLDDRQTSMLLAQTRYLHNLRRRSDALGRRLMQHEPAAIVARLRHRLLAARQRLTLGVAARLRRASDETEKFTVMLAVRHPRHHVRLAADRLDRLSERLTLAINGEHGRRIARLEALARLLQAVGPREVLARGYTITRLKRTGALLRSPSDVRAGDKLITTTIAGDVESMADDAAQPRLFD